MHGMLDIFLHVVRALEEEHYVPESGMFNVSTHFQHILKNIYYFILVDLFQYLKSELSLHVKADNMMVVGVHTTVPQSGRPAGFMPA